MNLRSCVEGLPEQEKYQKFKSILRDLQVDPKLASKMGIKTDQLKKSIKEGLLVMSLLLFIWVVFGQIPIQNIPDPLRTFWSTQWKRSKEVCKPSSRNRRYRFKRSMKNCQSWSRSPKSLLKIKSCPKVWSTRFQTWSEERSQKRARERKG